MWDWINHINGVLFHDYVVLVILLLGIVLTFLARVPQIACFRRGISTAFNRSAAGMYHQTLGPFDALLISIGSTVGLGNIGGTAIALIIGGPGALLIFWLCGLILIPVRMLEVFIVVRYRQKKTRVRGGIMYVLTSERIPRRFRVLTVPLACLFAASILIASVTGGQLFQHFNTIDVVNSDLGIPTGLLAACLSVAVGFTVLLGLRNLARVMRILVPLMLILYLAITVGVLATHVDRLPLLAPQLVEGLLSSTKVNGAFCGATLGQVFYWGLKRAAFDGEIAQGSTSIIHARTRLPYAYQQALVAGLEPFMSSIVVCSMTGLIVLTSGMLDRPADWSFDAASATVRAESNDDAELYLDDPTYQIELSGPEAEALRAWADHASEGQRVRFVIRFKRGKRHTFLDPIYWNSEDWTRSPDGSLQIRVNRSWRCINDHTIESEEIVIGSSDRVEVYINYDGFSFVRTCVQESGVPMLLLIPTVLLFSFTTVIAWVVIGESAVSFLATTVFRSDFVGIRSALSFRVLSVIMPFTSLVFMSDWRLDSATTIGLGIALWITLFVLIVITPVEGRRITRGDDDSRHSAGG